MGLSDGERISMIRLSRFNTIHACDRWTDRQTDGQTDGIGVAYTRYSIYAVACKNHQYCIAVVLFPKFWSPSYVHQLALPVISYYV